MVLKKPISLPALRRIELTLRYRRASMAIFDNAGRYALASGGRAWMTLTEALADRYFGIKAAVVIADVMKL